MNSNKKQMLMNAGKALLFGATTAYNTYSIIKHEGGDTSYTEPSGLELTLLAGVFVSALLTIYYSKKACDSYNAVRGNLK